jgi:catecholate siderophore receptor
MHPHPSHRSLIRLSALAASLHLAGSALAQIQTPAETVLPVIRAKGQRPSPRARTACKPPPPPSARVGRNCATCRSRSPWSPNADRRPQLDTLKDALKNTAGISFLAAEGGEEDIRLRGFSLQATGDIFIDGLRDPAFYERDSFNWDRLELLRGSASMLFGRGSTGGAVNQVSKLPRLYQPSEVALTLGSGRYARATADLNLKTGDNAAVRVNAMLNKADNHGARSTRAAWPRVFAGA